MTKSKYSLCLLGLAWLLPVGDAAALCVTASTANLRTGPGTRYQKTWEVFKYMPLQRIGRKGSWYRVRDVDGDRHWVHRSLVSTAIRCAVVKASRANVRTGPGTNYRKASWSPVERYYAFRTIGSQGRWVKVRDEAGDSGWVAGSLLWQQ